MRSLTFNAIRMDWLLMLQKFGGPFITMKCDLQRSFKAHFWGLTICLLWSNPLLAQTPCPANFINIPPEFVCEQLTTGLDRPFSFAFVPDASERIFFTERHTGNIRVIDANFNLLPTPFSTITPTPSTSGDGGTQGIAFDPDFENTDYVYVYYTENSGEFNEIIRFIGARNDVFDSENNSPEELGLDLPNGTQHVGKNFTFGPDGKLYVCVGDVGNSSNGQDTQSDAGKIHRFNPDGSIPEDNPSPGSSHYALGIRNTYDLEFNDAGDLFGAEHGPNGRNDELNIIVADGNYGWDIVAGIANDERFIDPVWDSGVMVAPPTGMTIYRNTAAGFGPEFDQKIFISTLNDNIQLHATDGTLEDENWAVAGSGFNSNFIFDVVAGADGNLYFITHNLGNANSDGLYRIRREIPVPVELASFEGFSEKGRVRLIWHTISESNNFGFEIQRKHQREFDYVQIGFVKGHGTTNRSNSYEFIDGNADLGLSYYRLKQIDTDGRFEFSEPIQVSLTPPTSFELAQNYPNPFNLSTTIEYRIPANATPSAKTFIAVYNVKGQLIQTLFDGPKEPGFHLASWDGRDGQGKIVPSGIYLYRMQTEEFSRTRKMTVLK